MYCVYYRLVTVYHGIIVYCPAFTGCATTKRGKIFLVISIYVASLLMILMP